MSDEEKNEILAGVRTAYLRSVWAATAGIAQFARMLAEFDDIVPTSPELIDALEAAREAIDREVVRVIPPDVVRTGAMRRLLEAQGPGRRERIQ